jgi:hypothetical protein
MAYGRKTGGANFPKGHKFSPGGKKLDPQYLEIRKKINSIDGTALLGKYCIMSYEDLLAKIDDHSIPVIDLMLIKMINRCILQAELPILIWIYARLGWDANLNEDDRSDIQQARLIIKLDNEGKPSHLEAKEK